MIKHCISRDMDLQGGGGDWLFSYSDFKDKFHCGIPEYSDSSIPFPYSEFFNWNSEIWESLIPGGGWRGCFKTT